MMPYVMYHVNSLFDGTNRDESEKTILWLLEVLTIRNCDYIQAHPEAPKLYDSGVVYEVPAQMLNRPSESAIRKLARFLKDNFDSDEETIDMVSSILRGIEIFRDIPAIIAKKRIDCDNLACWRSAELRIAGIKATPMITWRETPGGTTYHALVRWPDGTSEDPSILLGMGGESKARERAEERRKNRERFDNFVAAARQLCAVGDATPVEMSKKIANFGLLPQVGW